MMLRYKVNTEVQHCVNTEVQYCVNTEVQYCVYCMMLGARLTLMSLLPPCGGLVTEWDQATFSTDVHTHHNVFSMYIGLWMWHCCCILHSFLDLTPSPLQELELGRARLIILYTFFLFIVFWPSGLTEVLLSG